MTKKPVQQQAYELIELAIKLDPEGEGIELGDQDYQLADLVELKHRISSIRSACTIVTAALTQYWIDQFPYEEYVTEHDRYYVGGSKIRQWQDEDAAIGFAQWLKNQDADLIAKIVSIKGLRVTPMPKAVRATFFDETERTRRKTITTAQK